MLLFLKSELSLLSLSHTDCSICLIGTCDKDSIYHISRRTSKQVHHVVGGFAGTSNCVARIDAGLPSPETQDPSLSPY